MIVFDEELCDHRTNCHTFYKIEPSFPIRTYESVLIMMVSPRNNIQCQTWFETESGYDDVRRLSPPGEHVC